MVSIHRAWMASVLAVMFLLLLGVASGQETEGLSAKAWFDKGMLLREAGDPHSTDAFKQAVRDLDDVIDDKGKDPQELARAYTLRARCYNLLGNNEQAIQDLNKAVELSPEDGDIYYLRSFIHEIMGNSRLSLDDLKTSARKGFSKAQGELKAKGIQW